MSDTPGAIMTPTTAVAGATAPFTEGKWQIHGSHIYGPEPERELIAQVLSNDGKLVGDRDRIVHAVNTLPAYQACVEALRGLQQHVITHACVWDSAENGSHHHPVWEKVANALAQVADLETGA